MTTSPVAMLRPSLMKSVPSVHCRGIMVPMSCGFLTAFMETPETPFWPRREALRLSTGVTSFTPPRALVAGTGAKADPPGSGDAEKASVRGTLQQPRRAAATRMGAAHTAPRLRKADHAMLLAADAHGL